MSKSHIFSPVMQDINSLYLPANTNTAQTTKIVFILLEHFSMMSFTAAVDTLVTANLISEQKLFDIHSYALDKERVTSDLSIEIATHGALSTLEIEQSSNIDLLIICGGLRCSFKPNATLSKRLKQAQGINISLGSIWNGVIALAQAKTISHQQCAIHIDNHALLQEQFPEIKLSELNHCISEKLISCADANGALEMMLKLVEMRYSSALSRAVKAILNANKTGNDGTTHLVQYNNKEQFPKLLLNAIQLMNANIEEPIAIDELALLLATNRRQLERIFKQHLATSPSRHYLEIRLTYARRLLLQTSESITDIALATGFVSSNHFSYSFKQFFRIAPSICRKHTASGVQ